MDSIILHQFKRLHHQLFKMKNKINNHLSASEIDDIANDFIYYHLDKMLGQLNYDPNNIRLRNQFYKVSKRFQSHVKLDFGFGDVDKHNLTKDNAYRNRAWIIYEGTDNEQGLTAKVLFDYIKVMDSYIIKVIQNKGLVK